MLFMSSNYDYLSLEATDIINNICLENPLFLK